MSTQDSDQPIRRAQILSAATAKAAARFELTANDLGHILGISQASALLLMQNTLHLQEGDTSRERAILLVRLYRDVAAHFGNDDARVVTWLRSPNRAFDNASVYNLIQSTAGLVQACDYVDAHLTYLPS